MICRSPRRFPTSRPFRMRGWESRRFPARGERLSARGNDRNGRETRIVRDQSPTCRQSPGRRHLRHRRRGRLTGTGSYHRLVAASQSPPGFSRRPGRRWRLRVGLLLEDAADAMVVSSAVAAARLKVTSVGPILTRIALNDGKTGPVRTAALQALSDLEDPSLAKTVEALFTVSDPGVRGLALRLATRLGGPGAVPLLGAVLEAGRSDRQAAFSGWRIHDPAAAALLSDWMDRLISGKVADGLRLDLVEAAGRLRMPG